MSKVLPIMIHVLCFSMNHLANGKIFLYKDRNFNFLLDKAEMTPLSYICGL